MSKSKIPEKTKTHLWLLAGGRCQYRDCNKPLWRDELTMAKMNGAYIAHIVADSPSGPRGDAKRSESLSKDLNNLMLLCDIHHRLIDIENENGHPVNLLLQMKKEHEKRIEFLTSLTPKNRSHIVLFGANIGNHGSPLCFESSVAAILPDKYPAETYGIELGFENSSFTDHESFFWEMEATNLERQFKEKVEPKKIHNETKSFSLFALAPQPLLIKLGVLFSDLYEVEVFQRHREPATWHWQTSSTPFPEFKLIEPENCEGIPILNLSLSGTITDDRIKNLFDSKVSVWTITHVLPHNDFLKTKEHLSQFRKICRLFFDKAKSKHGQDSTLHVFPAMPVSASVEFGRIWMPKADMNLTIYDQNTKRNGFVKALEIKNN